MEFDKSKTSDKKSNLDDNDNDSVNAEDLLALANVKKLNKKSDEISLHSYKDSSKESKNSTKSKSKKAPMPKKNVSQSSVASTEDSSSYVRRRKRKINNENKSESTLKEKQEILYKLYSLVDKYKGRFSTNKNLDDSLDDIKSEYMKYKGICDNENMVKFCKHGLVMGIKGVEMLNNNFDPLGIDLDGWSEAMSYNMETNEYDEVISELYEKYKGSGTMSPEVKLVLMIVMSGAMFSFSKRAAKDPNMLTNLMGTFLNQKPKPQPHQPQQPQQPQHPQQQQQQYRPQQQQQQQQYRPQQNFMGPQHGFNPAFTIPGFSPLSGNQNDDLKSVNSDDAPSKIRGPLNSSDANIESIIKQMQLKKEQQEKLNQQQQQQQQNQSDSEIEVVKNVNIKTKRGRPPAKAKKGVAAR